MSPENDGMPLLGVAARESSGTRTQPMGSRVDRCHRVKPSIVCQVKFGSGRAMIRLRHPVFLGIREDKNASEGVREKAS